MNLINSSITPPSVSIGWPVPVFSFLFHFYWILCWIYIQENEHSVDTAQIQIHFMFYGELNAGVVGIEIQTQQKKSLLMQIRSVENMVAAEAVLWSPVTVLFYFILFYYFRAKYYYIQNKMASLVSPVLLKNETKKMQLHFVLLLHTRHEWFKNNIKYISYSLFINIFSPYYYYLQHPQQFNNFSIGIMMTKGILKIF